MDHSEKMQRVRRSFEQWEQMLRKHKADQDEKNSEMQMARIESDIQRREEKFNEDNYIKDQRVQFDDALEKSRSELARRARTEQTRLLNNTLNDQKAMYEKKIEQERALSNQILEKTRAENEANLKKEQHNFDCAIKQATEQLEELDNERLRLKAVIESLLQEEKDINMVRVPRRYLEGIIHSECGPDVVMRFKLHGVKEIYLDLEKYYDCREEFDEIEIKEPSIVEHWSLSNTLKRDYGYREGALLYYLNPAVGSQPSHHLVKIDGEEDVVEMMDAHAREGTKICHLYIVNGSGFGYEKFRKRRAWESDEETEQDDKSPVTKKRLSDD